MIYLAVLAMVVVVFLTSLLSGIFGMAGGLILLWILLFIVPVGTAIAVHGIIQIVANISRAWFSRHHIDLKIMTLITSGVVAASIIFYWLRYTPNLGVVTIVVGLVPLLVWAPASWFSLDASRPVQAVLCGFISGGLTIGVGVSGPIVDMFLIRTKVDRRRIIGTKSAVQVITHSIKVFFYWNSTFVLSDMEWLMILAASPFAIVGAQSGNLILARMSNRSYRKWARLIITGIGAVFLARGILLLM